MPIDPQISAIASESVENDANVYKSPTNHNDASATDRPMIRSNSMTPLQTPDYGNLNASPITSTPFVFDFVSAPNSPYTQRFPTGDRRNRLCFFRNKAYYFSKRLNYSDSVVGGTCRRRLLLLLQQLTGPIPARRCRKWN